MGGSGWSEMVVHAHIDTRYVLGLVWQWPPPLSLCALGSAILENWNLNLGKWKSNFE